MERDCAGQFLFAAQLLGHAQKVAQVTHMHTPYWKLCFQVKQKTMLSSETEEVSPSSLKRSSRR